MIAEIIALRKQRYKEIHSRLRSPVTWARRATGQVRKETAPRTKQEEKEAEHAPPTVGITFIPRGFSKDLGG